MDSENKVVTIKVSYNHLCSSSKDCSITVERESFIRIDDKEKLVAFLRSDFKLGDLKDIKILRKSKKHKDYIPLETDSDFKSLSRSLKVKNHIKLLINDSTPATKFCSPNILGGDFEKKKTIDFASLGKALVEASFTVLSDFRGEEFQAHTKPQTQPTQPQTRTQSAKGQFEEKPKDATNNDCVHELVACDSCNPTNFVPIKGVRFKCLICRDYDLCQACESKQHVEEKNNGDHLYTHPMIKITKPLLDSRTNCPRAFSNSNDIIYDIPLNGCSLANKDKIESILGEGSINDFFKNVDKIIEESDRYKILSSLLKTENIQDEDEDTKFAMLQSLVESSNVQADICTSSQNNEGSDDQETKSADEIDISINLNHEPESLSEYNKVQIYTKRFSQDARVISLVLYNNSSIPISGGDLKFEFYDSNASEVILVKNVRAILSGEKRSYNLGILTEKFNSLSGRRLKISTTDDSIIMDGNYSPGETTSLNIMNKPILANLSDIKSEKGSIEVVLVPKSNSMAQIIITNKSKTRLDCSNLKFKVINCFDQVVCNLSVVHGRKILPERTTKYNIGLSNAHLKYPFKLLIVTDSFFASCDLSLKNLNGVFEVIPKEKWHEDVSVDNGLSDSLKFCDKEADYPSSDTESFVNESQKNDKIDNHVEELSSPGDTEKTEMQSNNRSTEGSVHFVVLPTLPKESLLESKNLSSSEYDDAKSFLAHENGSTTDNKSRHTVDDANDYDIISMGEEEECVDSDFEVLSPAISH
ncbi:DEHA2F18216p [Debaryomyces hansenii CBS767]|uniref:DEHA2F18216p n=1 Tax=Debaryomyces hansenii (strain ATCC 36239 / CBS 767 / BCRC 21394 / JCM 1990 / NBRC 0083 / IGC 2968) TaxID=284592 RepID=Q6BKX1_DEBHA|nr:DEHA2F18216p [Debaryomyces hansenii CBS767]CAG89533.2 DEHA2F18216p [Debaryomyces hansenii CBS767]|eukprot:XP_461150.2 DEHA2F18216p [Debaryomyces hansenii CBS767]